MSGVRHRYLIFLPFVVLLLGTVIAGQFNAVDAHGVVVDGSTGSPVPNVKVSYGSRFTVTDKDGHYDLLNLPRGSRLLAQAQFSYGQATAAADATKIELPPITLNLQVNQKGSGNATASPSPIPPLGVKNPQVRQNDKVLGTGTDTGSVVVVPYPEVGSKLLVCAEGYTSTQIEARGISQTVELEFGGTGCPPLPSPSPSGAPSGSPTASPTAPAPSPSPSATP